MLQLSHGGCYIYGSKLFSMGAGHKHFFMHKAQKKGAGVASALYEHHTGDVLDIVVALECLLGSSLLQVLLLLQCMRNCSGLHCRSAYGVSRRRGIGATL
ncbi:MAG TPA: hypothetical protein VGE70_12240 [Burkholderiaceae bacterium]